MLIERDPFGFFNHKQAANFQTNHQEGQNLESPIFDQEHKTTEDSNEHTTRQQRIRQTTQNNQQTHKMRKKNTKTS